MWDHGQRDLWSNRPMARECSSPSTLSANSLTTPTLSLSAFCALATRLGILRSLKLFLLVGPCTDGDDVERTMSVEYGAAMVADSEMRGDAAKVGRGVFDLLGGDVLFVGIDDTDAVAR